MHCFLGGLVKFDFKFSYKTDARKPFALTTITIKTSKLHLKKCIKLLKSLRGWGGVAHGNLIIDLLCLTIKFVK